MKVQINVASGVTEGRTVCWNSWTSPPVIETLGIFVGSRKLYFKPEKKVETDINKENKAAAELN